MVVGAVAANFVVAVMVDDFDEMFSLKLLCFFPVVVAALSTS